MKEEIPILTEINGNGFAALSMGAGELFVDDLLQSLKMDVAVLDQRGTILKTSRTLLGFGGAMAADLAGEAVGLHYQQIIGPAQTRLDPVAAWVVDAVESILRGTGEETSLEYSREGSG